MQVNGLQLPQPMLIGQLTHLQRQLTRHVAQAGYRVSPDLLGETLVSESRLDEIR